MPADQAPFIFEEFHDDEDQDEDEQLLVDEQERNLQQVAVAVTQRLVDFLAMEEPAAEEDVDAVDEVDVLSDDENEEDEHEYELVVPNYILET